MTNRGQVVCVCHAPEREQAESKFSLQCCSYTCWVYSIDGVFDPSPQNVQKNKMLEVGKTLQLSRQMSAVPDLCCIVTRRSVGSVGGVFDPIVTSAIAVFARQRRTCSNTLFAPSDLVTCMPGSRPL